MTDLQDVLRRSAATFIFSSLGVIGGGAIVGVDATTLELAVLTGIGAVLNLAYRWAEKELKR
jgi:hypothetical protein